MAQRCGDSSRQHPPLHPDSRFLYQATRSRTPLRGAGFNALVAARGITAGVGLRGLRGVVRGFPLTHLILPYL
jgi:hypothetical protein